MDNEDKKWENCEEFDDLVWIEYQFIQFVKIGDKFELRINQEGIQSLTQNLAKLSRNWKNRIVYLDGLDLGDVYVGSPSFYLDGGIRVNFMKLYGTEEILRATYAEMTPSCYSEIYFEGTKKGLEKLIKVLNDTKNEPQQMEIESVDANGLPFHFRTFLVNKKGRRL